MNTPVPDDVKHLIGDGMTDSAPQDDGDLDYESFVKEYGPEATCQGEDRNDDDEGADDAHDPLAKSFPTDDEFDPPTTDRLDYAPSRHELLQLARYWTKESLSFVVNYYLFGFTGGYESRLAAISGVRLRRIARLVGDEAVQAVDKQVEDEYRWSPARSMFPHATNCWNWPGTGRVESCPTQPTSSTKRKSAAMSGESSCTAWIELTASQKCLVWRPSRKCCRKSSGGTSGKWGIRTGHCSGTNHQMRRSTRCMTK